MTGKTHDLVGISVGGATAAAFGLPVWAGVVMTASACMTSRWPDKAEGNWATHRGPTHRVWTPLLFVGFVLGGTLLIWHVLSTRLSTNIKPLEMHRLYALLMHLLPYVLIGVALGCTLHLIADACTQTGVPWRKTRVHLLPRGYRFTTGGWAERVFQVVIISVWIVLAVLEVRNLGHFEWYR
jgi:hypothetical protein